MVNDINTHYDNCLNWVKTNIVDFAQDEKEFKWFWDKVHAYQPKILVEIGSRSGGTFYMLAHACPKDSLIISIDLPNGPWGNQYSVNKLNMVFDKLINEGYKNTKIIWGDSKDFQIKQKLVSYLNFKTIDVLFIDGDHTFEGVHSDWKMYGLLSNGFIGFHDINQKQKHIHNPPIEVWKLWNNIKPYYDHLEFINKPEEGMGIGIIYTW